MDLHTDGRRKHSAKLALIASRFQSLVESALRFLAHRCMQVLLQPPSAILHAGGLFACCVKHQEMQAGRCTLHLLSSAEGWEGRHESV